MRNYYYQPPTTPDKLPPFMRSRYYDVPSSVKKFIYWANAEYNKLVREATRHSISVRAIRYLHEEYSAIRVLAEMEGFRDLIGLITEENWNQLTPKERRFINNAYLLYQKLS